MTKNKLWLVVGVSILLLSVVLVYWFYLSKPAVFPGDDRLIKEINALNSNIEADFIQDTILLDEYHAYVPFVSAKGNYGMSFWVWEKQKWNVSSVDTSGGPVIWKVNEMDPSSYHFAWNKGFDESIQHMKLFLIRDRSFQVSGKIEDYSPGVQMEKSVDMSKKSYGAVSLPDEWVSVVESYSEYVSPKKTDIFDSIFPAHLMFFAWNAYDSKGNVTLGGLQSSNSSFHNGHEIIEFVRFLDEMEME